MFIHSWMYKVKHEFMGCPRVHKIKSWVTWVHVLNQPDLAMVGGQVAKNSLSSHLHALTTCEWVRTPYVTSTCKYGLWRQRVNRKMSVRCKHVVSMYNSLATCAAYDARNRSRPGVACGPRTCTLRKPCEWRALTYFLPALATPSPRFQKNVAAVASPKHVRTKNTHGGLWPRL